MPDVVGLAFQDRMLRGVEVRIGRRGRCTVLRTGSVPLPLDVFASERPADQPQVTESIETLWASAGFRSKRVRIGIDGRTAVVRRTELPSAGPEQLRRAASYDIAELLSYPIDEAVFDVDEIERFDRDGTTWARALVVAVRESALTELETITRSSGLRLVGSDLVAEALARSVEHKGQEFPEAIVDCEDSLTNVVVRDHTGVLFARTLNVGVGATSISVADELESALAQLQGEPETDADRRSESSVGIATAVEGIRRTLSYYSAELDDRPIASIVVVGGRASSAGLLPALEQSLGIDARHAVPAVDWPEHDGNFGFELALGVALGSAKAATRHLVLTSDRERQAVRRRNQRVASLAIALPVCAALGMATIGLREESLVVEDSSDLAQGGVDRLALQVENLDDTRALGQTWQAGVNDIATVDEQRLRLALVVAELAEAMPADSRLISVQLRRAGEEVGPTGYVGPPPIGLITVTAVTDDLDGVGRWLEQVEEAQTIEGLWLGQSSYGPLGAADEVGAIFTVEGVITGAARQLEPLVDPATQTDDGDGGLP